MTVGRMVSGDDAQMMVHAGAAAEFLSRLPAIVAQGGAPTDDGESTSGHAATF